MPQIGASEGRTTEVFQVFEKRRNPSRKGSIVLTYKGVSDRSQRIGLLSGAGACYTLAQIACSSIPRSQKMKRFAILLYGLLCYVIFLGTFLYAIWFVYTMDAAPVGVLRPRTDRLLIDAEIGRAHV